MKSVKKWLVGMLAALLLLCIGIACASCQSSDSGTSITSVEGASIDEKDMSVFMVVDNNTESVSLANKIVCSADSVWRLYYDKLGQTEIPTKIATGKTGALNNGDNVFYIVVTSSNGSQVSVYELTVHRSYRVAINYYSNKNTLLDQDYVYTGDTYSANYSPTIDGYTFNYWKNSEGKKTTEFVPYTSVSLYADCTANAYKATLDVNGGDEISTTKKTITYDTDYSFAVPTRTGYTFLGWYLDDTAITTASGKSIVAWNFTSDKTIKAKWKINSYTITLDQNNTKAGIVSGNGDYQYNSPTTITAISNKGYDFLGWYKRGLKLTDELIYTFTMPAENATYTARWEVDEQMENFTFTSTTTTCEISDISKKTVTEIILPDYVTSISKGAFSECNVLTSIVVDEKNTAFSSIDGVLFNKDQTSLICYPAAKKGSYSIPSGVENIEDYAFYFCSSLTSVTIPNGVTNIGKYAFYFCSSLTSVTIPNSVTNIGSNAFSGCSSLTSVNFKNRQLNKSAAENNVI